jgi:hypothetical protein
MFPSFDTVSTLMVAGALLPSQDHGQHPSQTPTGIPTGLRSRTGGSRPRKVSAMTPIPSPEHLESIDNDVWPPEHINGVLDALASLAEHVVDWPVIAWETVAVAATSSPAERARARELAHETAARLERTRMVTFAHDSVAAGPHLHVRAGALQALRDALTATLLADALPGDAYHRLMQPLATASEGVQQAAWAHAAGFSLAIGPDEGLATA